MTPWAQKNSVEVSAFGNRGSDGFGKTGKRNALGKRKEIPAQIENLVARGDYLSNIPEKYSNPGVKKYCSGKGNKSGKTNKEGCI